MATLPASDLDLSQGVVFREKPSLTWIADPVTKRLRGRGGRLGGRAAGGGGHRPCGALPLADILPQFRHGF